MPGGPVYTYKQILSDAHIKARDMVIEYDHPKIGRMKSIGIPVKSSGELTSVRQPAPWLGQHSAETARDLGMAAGLVVGEVFQPALLPSGLGRHAGKPVGVDGRIGAHVHRRRRALEHVQLLGRRAEVRDALDGGGPGADDPDALVGQLLQVPGRVAAGVLVVPPGRVEGLAGETVDPVDALAAVPAEEDVAGRLDQSLALDHAPTLVLVPARREVLGQHRGKVDLGRDVVAGLRAAQLFVDAARIGNRRLDACRLQRLSAGEAHIPQQLRHRVKQVQQFARPLARLHQRRQLVQRTTLLEGRGELQVLELQEDLRASDLRQRARFDAGRDQHLPPDAVSGLPDVVDADHGAPLWTRIRAPVGDSPQPASSM